MAPKIDLIRIFVAGPSDVDGEIKTLTGVVSEINIILANSKSNKRLELLNWKSHVSPNIGEDSQAVINEQIGYEYEIFIGILWKTFGTPTKHALSGTAEEYDRAYNMYVKDSNKIRVMFYFKTQGLPLNQINPEQLKLINDFQNKIKGNGTLYGEFTDTEDFEDLVRIHLNKHISDFGISWGQDNTSKISEKDFEAIQQISPIKGVVYDELGFLDFEDTGVKQFELATETSNHIIAFTKEITNKMNSSTEEMKLLKKPVPNEVIRQFADRLAIDLDNFAERVAVETPILSKSFRTGIDAFGKSGQLLLELGEDKITIVEQRLATVRSLQSAIRKAINGVKQFRDAVNDFPRLTSKLNHSKRRTTLVLDSISNEYSSFENLTTEVEKQLIEALELRKRSLSNKD